MLSKNDKNLNDFSFLMRSRKKPNFLKKPSSSTSSKNALRKIEDEEI